MPPESRSPICMTCCDNFDVYSVAEIIIFMALNKKFENEDKCNETMHTAKINEFLEELRNLFDEYTLSESE